MSTADRLVTRRSSIRVQYRRARAEQVLFAERAAAEAARQAAAQSLRELEANPSAPESAR